MSAQLAAGVNRREFLVTKLSAGFALALKAAGNPSEIVVYPDAGHGFNADYRPGYNKEAAQDGWQRLQEWFKKYGAA